MAGFCTQCGTTLAGHERFCPNCGTATPPEPEVAVAPPAASSPWSAPRPTVAAPPPPPPFQVPAFRTHHRGGTTPASPGTRPTSRTLAAWLQVLLWISAGVLVISAVVVIVRMAAQDFYDAPAGTDFDEAQRWIDREDLGSALSAFESLLAIAVFVLLVIWAFQLTRAVNRHHRRAHLVARLGGRGVVHPAGEHGAVPDDPVGGREDRHGRRFRGARSVEVGAPPAGTIVWFVLWAIAGVLLTIGSDSLDRTDQADLPSRTSVMTGYTVYIVGALIGAMAAAVAALTVRHLTRLDHGSPASTSRAPSGWETASAADPGEPSTMGWAPPR